MKHQMKAFVKVWKSGALFFLDLSAAFDLVDHDIDTST